MSKTTTRNANADLQKYVFKIGKRCREWFLPLEGEEAEPLRRHGVIVSGHSVLRPPYVMSRPGHTFYILLMPYAGELTLTMPKKKDKIRAGEIWLMPPTALYRYELTRGEMGMTWFHFDANSISMPHNDAPARLAWHGDVINRMKFYFTTLSRQAHHPDGELRRKFYELIGVELRRLPVAGQDTANVGTVTRIRRVWDELEQNLHEDWNVAAIAAKAGFSSSRFHALSVEYFGVSPHEKLTRMRMNRACALLRLTNHKTEVIARELGYSTAFAFSKTFKKTVGVNPTAYRTLES